MSVCMPSLYISAFVRVRLFTQRYYSLSARKICQTVRSRTNIDRSPVSFLVARRTAVLQNQSFDFLTKRARTDRRRNNLAVPSLASIGYRNGSAGTISRLVFDVFLRGGVALARLKVMREREEKRSLHKGSSLVERTRAEIRSTVGALHMFFLLTLWMLRHLSRKEREREKTFWPRIRAIV